MVLSLMGGGTPKFGADLEGVYSTYQLGGGGGGEVWGHAPPMFLKFLMCVIGCEVFWGDL